MLTLEAPQFQINGLTIFRDFAIATHFWYLPRNSAQISEKGKGLNFVAYTEDLTNVPDFSLSEDRAGGFLTLEVELGPSEAELEEIRAQLASQAGVGNITLTQVPFKDGSVTLYILGQSGGQSDGSPKGFNVSVAGSTKPSLYGNQTAVFSVRLGGQAANVLYETLRKASDPQAVVTYDLEFLGLRPAYNLEVTIKFKDTFQYIRHRIGANLLLASVDLDILTQEMMNKGTITVREIDYKGSSTTNSPISGEGGILKLIRDLMSPTLFNALPIPTPDYRALPDSATNALSTHSGTNQFLSVGGRRAPITVGNDLRLTHTPVAGGQAIGSAAQVNLDIVSATGVNDQIEVKLRHRIKGESKEYREVTLTRVTGQSGASGTGSPTSSGTSTGGTTSGSGTSGAGVPSGSGTSAGTGAAGGNASGTGTTPTSGNSGTNTPPSGTGSGSGTSESGGSGATTGSASAGTGSNTTGSGSGTGTSATGTGAAGGQTEGAEQKFSGSIPGQPSGKTVEYYFSASSTKNGNRITQTLPEDSPERNPLSYSVGAEQQSSVSLKVPQTDGPLIGYSLRMINVEQLVERTFTFNRTEAEVQHYHPSGILSRNGIGPDFDPSKQITRVQIGEGPFKLLIIKVQAGFDFSVRHILSAKVHIEYGVSRTGSGPMHALDVVLTKEKPNGQVQFFADDAGTQEYSYFVEFTYDPDRVVGVSGEAIRSQMFTSVKTHSITVDLDLHSPLIPVEVMAGVINFREGIIKQVQVRVAATKTAEGRIIVLSADSARDLVYVMPADQSNRVYYMQQTFFFKDDATTIERQNVTDNQVIVNEPTDLVFRIKPKLIDPWNLIKEALVDATYQHSDGEREIVTLHCEKEGPASEFAVLLRPGDRREWNMAPRFVLKEGEPVTAQSKHVTESEPFVGLTQAGLRVAGVELLDASVFDDSQLQGIKTTFGGDLSDATLPVVTVLLRKARTNANLIVPGLFAGAPVSVAIEPIFKNQPAQRKVMTLGPSETTAFVTV